MTLKNNLCQIEERITAACQRAGRDRDAVRLVAVSKTKPAAQIEAAAAAGQLHFGENYVQEFLQKAEQVQAPVHWHFIGSLQSNKVKYLRGKTELIHSVDRISLAREIDRQWRKDNARANILIQVNLGAESTKGGTTPEGLEDLVRQVAPLPGLRICGLMALPPYCPTPEDVRPYFRRLRTCAEELDRLAIAGVEMRELSMGMSHDFEIAIEEGATLIRVGSAIFGERERK